MGRGSSQNWLLDAIIAINILYAIGWVLHKILKFLLNLIPFMTSEGSYQLSLVLTIGIILYVGYKQFK